MNSFIKYEDKEFKYCPKQSVWKEFKIDIGPLKLGEKNDRTKLIISHANLILDPSYALVEP